MFINGKHPIFSSEKVGEIKEENRENESQKKIITNKTNLFSGIKKNCSAILNHRSNEKIIPNTLPLLEKLDFLTLL